MKVKTDKDVYRYVKDIMRNSRFGNILDIHFKFPYTKGGIEYHKFNINNIDELAVKMFDFSMTKRVSEIHSFLGDYYGRVVAFEISLSESSDYQTNITPQMIDFFTLIVDPSSRDILVEALKPPKPDPIKEDYLNWNGRFIIAPMVETNPWDYFEKDIHV